MYRARNLAKALTGLMFLIVLSVWTVSAVYAQEVTEEQLKVAKQTVAAARSTEALDRILPQMAERAKQQLISNRPDLADQYSAIVDEVAISLAPRRGDLEEEVARAYARVFTIDELKLITTFYTSDAGKKLIEQTPVIARSIEQAARVWQNGVQRDMQAAISKKMQEAGLQ